MTTSSLKRSVNLPLLTLYGLGTILGAGIYVLVGKVAGVAGIYAPIAFFVSTVLATFTAFSYAELSARYPRSAGEALYVKQAFSWPFLAAIVGWLVITTGIVSAATITKGFVGYLAVFVDIPPILSMSLLLLCITLLACWGITESATTAAIITSIELIGLLLVLWTLKGEFLTLPERWPDLLPPLNGGIWLSILLGAFLAFYAFIGFEDMVNIAEEVVNPKRTMPLAIFTALGVSSLLYILISVVAILSLPLNELSQSDSPMVSLLEKRNQSIALSVGFISLIAVVNGALVQIIMGARMLYGMGYQHLAPGWLAHVALKTRTPIRATLLIAMIVWILAVGFSLVTLAKVTSFIIIGVFAMVNGSLAAIKIREQYPGERITIGTLIPIIGMLLCIGFLILQVFSLYQGTAIGGH